MKSNCETCSGAGTYLDRRCRNRECSHLGKKSAEGKFGKPVMPCPERPCKCNAGAKFRAILKDRIKKQNARLDDQVGSMGRDWLREIPKEIPEVKEAELPALPGKIADES